MTNSGFEIATDYTSRIGRLGYSVYGNFSFARNRVKEMQETDATYRFNKRRLPDQLRVRPEIRRSLLRLRPDRRPCDADLRHLQSRRHPLSGPEQRRLYQRRRPHLPRLRRRPRIRIRIRHRPELPRLRSERLFQGVGNAQKNSADTSTGNSAPTARAM